MIFETQNKRKLMPDIYGFDAFSPTQIAEKVETIGVTKARLPFLPMIMLGILAGAFIGLGALFFTLVTSDTGLGFATSRVLGGVVFSLGLILVVIAGAELFTGNNLLVMAWADGRISTGEVLQNWLIVLLSNLVGAVLLAVMVSWSGHTGMNQGGIELQYLKIAAMKCSLPFGKAFFSGIMCNILVCLAVWMAMAGRSVIDKVIAIVFPIATFVAAGFEHSIANMYFITMGLLVKVWHPEFATVHAITLKGFFLNMGPVILGNMVGGGVFVALVYYVIYGKLNKPASPA